ncbi:MAG TPA: four helix bundle protein [Puia sp.]|jgi:four helix bundle protein|nr:four helix bundle protein [Puia sp.]
MNAEEMKRRTKQFSIDVGHLVLQLERTDLNRNYNNQTIRSSSSVGTNYRAVRRAKSKADFINKLKIVEEELDESLFFLELLHEFNSAKVELITKIYKEVEELLKIIVATINSSRS